MNMREEGWEGALRGLRSEFREKIICGYFTAQVAGGERIFERFPEKKETSK
jgi:hypothetical protein